MVREIEEILINSYQGDQVKYIKKNPGSLSQLIHLALGDVEPISWRSAYLIASGMKRNDERLRESINSFISVLPEKKDGHQREIIKILSNMNLNDEQEGEFYDICYKLFQQPDKQASVKVNALKFVLRMVKKYPELKSEAEYLSRKHFLTGLSHGALNSVGKLFKQTDVNIKGDFL